MGLRDKIIQLILSNNEYRLRDLLTSIPTPRNIDDLIVCDVDERPSTLHECYYLFEGGEAMVSGGVVNVLLEYGNVSTSTLDCYDQCALYYFCQSGNFSAVEAILAFNTSMGIKPINNNVILTDVIISNNVDILRLLIKNGYNLNFKDVLNHFDTPLHVMCYSHVNIDMFELILDNCRYSSYFELNSENVTCLDNLYQQYLYQIDSPLKNTNAVLQRGCVCREYYANLANSISTDKIGLKYANAIRLILNYVTV